jgi:methylated-DNA-[protein]-cysteine S-methyltransferase
VWTAISSVIGQLTVVAEGDALTELWFEPAGGAGPTSPGRAAPGGRSDDHPLLRDAVTQLRQYLAGDREVFDIPLAPKGSGFQQRVWAALREIPYGTTVSYGDIARRLGLSPGASRAVGLANRANPLPIIIPCHRVIGADGSLTGFSGGLRRKRFLLDLEIGSGRPGVDPESDRLF